MKVFNSLSNKKEILKPLRSGRVSIYTCGPTVYWTAHIGNLRTYIFEDIFKRTLLYNGYSVKHVMNVTDVGHLTGDSDTGEDKVELAAKKAGLTASAITHRYFKEFKDDLERVNVLMPDKFGWATKYIKEQKELVEVLYKKKYVYITEDGIYFDISRFDKYGVLGGVNKRLDKGQKSRLAEHGDKKHPFDFAVWKFSQGPHLQEWTSPLGIKKKGFPGWHLECSAIARAELGQPFDVHMGGVDHTTVHHNAEIAQSMAAYNRPLAKYWMHGEFLLVSGDKMGKSKQNIFTLSEVAEKGFDPLAFRYFLLTGHYRSQVNFSWSAVEGATQNLNKLRGYLMDREKGGKVVARYQKKFQAALNDDMNLPEALAVMWEMLKSSLSVADKQATLLDFDKVLGLDLDKVKPDVIPAAVKKLVEERNKLKAKKNYVAADIMRERIEKMGYTIMDTPEGQKIKRK